MSAPRVLVATCGNPDAGDDAFGPRVGEILRADPPAGVEIVDLDIKPTALLDHLPGPRRLVLVDAVRVEGGRPRDLLIVDLQQEGLPALLHDDALSSHGLGLADQIALAREIGVLPERVWLVGAPVAAVTMGAPAREELNEIVGRAARRIRELVVES